MALALALAAPVASMTLTPAAAAEGLRARRAKLVELIDPARGFVDSPFGFDREGKRLFYVNANAAELTRLHLLDLESGKEIASVDLSGFTSSPVVVELTRDGDRYFVVSREGSGASATAAVLDTEGKIVRRFGPADDIVRTEHEGVEVVSLYRRERTGGKAGEEIRHAVEVVNLKTGKRVGKRTVLATNAAGFSKSLDFELRHWAQGYTRAVGIKGGSWDRKTDMRSPDHEAWYDLPLRRFVKRIAIANPIEHTRLIGYRSERTNETSFLRVAEDLSGVIVVDAKSMLPVRLRERFDRYDPKSLRYHVAEDGAIFFSLQVDPLNAEAVERKRRDTAWLDLYLLEPGSDRAVRKARILPPDRRPLSWRATRRHAAFLPGHIGFDRGGERLLLYQFD